nr:MAG TPA: hypothetical protein [Caudoviricetes sp.]
MPILPHFGRIYNHMLDFLCKCAKIHHKPPNDRRLNE